MDAQDKEFWKQVYISTTNAYIIRGWVSIDVITKRAYDLADKAIVDLHQKFDSEYPYR